MSPMVNTLLLTSIHTHTHTLKRDIESLNDTDRRGALDTDSHIELLVFLFSSLFPFTSFPGRLDAAGDNNDSVKMKLNISFPANGTQKLIDIDDERKLGVFMDRRMGHEVPGDSVGDEFKGYVFRITGGNDKQGFPMKQGVMHPTRVRLLLAKGHSCYRPRRTGERKRKSVRGCIVAADLAVLALSIVKKGDDDIPGLTDKVEPKRLGPKRATKIRRFFNLSKDDDVRLLLNLILSLLLTLTPKGPQICHPPRNHPQGRGQKDIYQSPPHPTPRHSPARPAQAPPTGAQAPATRAHQGRRSMLLPHLFPAVSTLTLLQNEYAQLLAKRATEKKEGRAEDRKRRASSMRK